MGFVENVLSHLADMSPERLTRAIYGRSDGQVKSILRKANIPSACQLLLRGAIEVAGAARGQNIILSEEGFGLRLVEVIMMRLPVSTTAEKLRLLDLVSRFAGDDVRDVTARLKIELGRAAAA